MNGRGPEKVKRVIPGDWHPGFIPESVIIDKGGYIETTYSFSRYRSLAEIGVRIGRSTGIYRGSMFDLGPQATVTVGNYALLHGARIISDTHIHIGDYTMISWRVVIMDTYRVSPDRIERRKQLSNVCKRSGRDLASNSTQGRVNIGANVWIGFDTCILPNVSIGDCAVVGARSVVCEDVPAGAVVAGNPAEIIRTCPVPDDWTWQVKI